MAETILGLDFNCSNKLNVIYDEEITFGDGKEKLVTSLKKNTTLDIYTDSRTLLRNGLATAPADTKIENWIFEPVHEALTP